MRKWVYLAVSLLLFSSLTFAVGEKLFTWTPPTERVDATPLVEAEIKEYKIYCDGDANAVWTQSHVPSGNQMWQAPAGTFALGTHSCHATTVDTLDQESDPSNTVNFTVSPALPRPPTLAVQ